MQIFLCCKLSVYPIVGFIWCLSCKRNRFIYIVDLSVNPIVWFWYFLLSMSNIVIVLIICPKLISPYRLCFQCCYTGFFFNLLMCFITGLVGHYLLISLIPQENTSELLLIGWSDLPRANLSPIWLPHAKSMFQVLYVFWLSDEFWKEDTIVSMSRWVLTHQSGN